MTPETEALIRAAVAVDVLNAASAVFWRRRAEEFENAKPCRGEFHGQATHEELNAAWQRAHDTAQACRRRALIAEMGGASWCDQTDPGPTRLAS